MKLKRNIKNLVADRLLFRLLTNDDYFWQLTGSNSIAHKWCWDGEGHLIHWLTVDVMIVDAPEVYIVKPLIQKYKDK